MGSLAMRLQRPAELARELRGELELLGAEMNPRASGFSMEAMFWQDLLSIVLSLETMARTTESSLNAVRDMGDSLRFDVAAPMGESAFPVFVDCANRCAPGTPSELATCCGGTGRVRVTDAELGAANHG